MNLSVTEKIFLRTAVTVHTPSATFHPTSPHSGLRYSSEIDEVHKPLLNQAARPTYAERQRNLFVDEPFESLMCIARPKLSQQWLRSLRQRQCRRLCCRLTQGRNLKLQSKNSQLLPRETL